MPDEPKRGEPSPKNEPVPPSRYDTVDPVPLAEITPPRRPKQFDVEIQRPDPLVPKGGGGGWPRNLLADAGDGILAPVETVGKVRIRLQSERREPLAYALFRIVAHTGVNTSDRGDAVVLASGIADAYGYASLDLSAVERARISELAVEVETAPVSTSTEPATALRIPIGRDHFATHRDAGIPHEIAVPDEVAIAVRRSAEPVAPRIEDPDARDAENSPESFSFATENVDGTCCLKPNAELAARQFFFNQLVRLDAPDLVAGLRAAKGRADVRAPIPFGDGGPSTFVVHAGEPVLGSLNLYRHAWYPAARGLGELLYSLPLAPCEQVKLAIVDWARDEENTRREELVSSERLQHEMHRNRTIEESVAAILTEEQMGWSAAVGVGLSLSLGEFSIGGGGGGGTSTSTGVRELQESTVQKIADAVVQQSSVLRTQRATVVTTSTQQESERIQTRVVHNHNRNHAMTVQYFQVLSHYRVRTELVEERPVLMVPYAIDGDIFDTLPNFETFKTAPSRPITRFLDRHRLVIQSLVPRSYEDAFTALARLLHCGDVYQYEEPYATGSRWRVSMSQAWRPGVTLEIETTDGQSVELRPRMRGRAASTVEFQSDPVDLATIDRLRVGFDPSSALENLPPAIARLRGEAFEAALARVVEYTIARCELHVRTDPSRFLGRPQQFRVPIQVSETTLSPTNPAASFDLAPVDVSFAKYQGQQHRDYCRVKELIALVQSDPMRFLRAIWLAENRDRRAIRLDRFEFASRPLLDQIENRPVGVFGNLVAFPLLEGHRYVPATKPRAVFSERLVSVPTPGVFAEVFLSCCNATEVRDVTRAIDPESSCGIEAPDITGVAPGSRRDRADTTPSPFAAPVVNIQNPLALPDPSGLGPALSALTASNVFRDMSLGSDLLGFIGAATAGAQQSTREFQQQRAALAAQMLAGLLGLPAPEGGAASSPTASPFNPGGGAAPASTSPQPSLRPSTPPSTPASITVPPNQGLQVANASLARQTPAPQLFDHVRTIEQARNANLITQDEAGQLTNALLGGGVGSQNVILASLPTGGTSLVEPKGRPCCAIGFDLSAGGVFTLSNIVDRTTLKKHTYGESGALGDDGLVYTCRGGIIDTGHVRDCADYAAYIAVNVIDLLGGGGTLNFANDKDSAKTRKVEFHATHTTPSVELAALLGHRISYELAIWHEIQTWFTVSKSWPERYSAFSPEDNYSNLLGCYIGAEAILDRGRPYNEAMTAALDRNLASLGAVSAADTRVALTTVKDRWWDSAKKLPDSGFLLRRHMEPFVTVTPWLLLVSPCGPSTPIPLDVPSSVPSGRSLASFYEFKIEVDTSVVPTSALPDPSRTTITPLDFPHLVDVVRADVLALFPDGDKP